MTPTPVPPPSTSSAPSCSPSSSPLKPCLKSTPSFHDDPSHSLGGKGEIVWMKEEESEFICVCLEHILDFKTLRELERRVRSGTGSEHLFHEETTCCSDPSPVNSTPAPPPSASSSSSVDQTSGSSECLPADSSVLPSGEKEGEDGSCGKKCEGDGSQKVNKTLTNGESSRCNDPHHHHKPHSHGEKKKRYKIQKNEDDYVGSLLDDVVSERGLRPIIGTVATNASDIYIRVIKKAKDDPSSPPPTPEEEQSLKLDILKEALMREIQKKTYHALRSSHTSDSLEGGLLAMPGGYVGSLPLDLLDNSTLYDLMHKGYAVQDGLMGEKMRDLIYREVELLEFEGQLSDVIQHPSEEIRKDRICWMQHKDLDRERQKGLYSLMDRLLSLPFELNKKANLGCQVGSVFQLAMYPSNGAYYKKHMDSGFTKQNDTGRKVTVIYYPNDRNWKESDGGYLRLFCRMSKSDQMKKVPKKKKDIDKSTNDLLHEGDDANEIGSSKDINNSQDDILTNICPKGDRLVLFRSRELPSEVMTTHKKRFAITFWITGPVGPGDKPEDISV